MKRFLFIIILIVALVGGFYIYQNRQQVLNHDLLTFSYCEEPILYRIDTVDPRFKIAESEFKSRTNQAAQLWNQNYQTPLFVEDPNGKLTVNLVFDSRQTISNQINSLEDKLTDSKDPLQSRIKEYTQRSAKFKTDVETLNQEIEKWNQQGGAPPEIYGQLNQRRNQLENEAQFLNTLSEELNLSTQDFNRLVGQLNTTINTFNDALAIKPEEGVYDSAQNRIEVYFNINKNEMVHTIAHELGHSLEVPHNNNQLSIMYPSSGKTLKLSSEDLADFNDICRQRSYLEIIQNYILTIQRQLAS